MPPRARRPPLSIRLPRRAFSARSSAAAATTATSTPATPLRLLIVEAYDRAGRERLASAGCTTASDTFAALLSRICPEDHELRLSYCHPADSVHELAEVGELSRFDGVVCECSARPPPSRSARPTARSLARLSTLGGAGTGSSLTIHEDKPEVTRQIELARRCFQAAVPQYGSCWGLQISATAAGIPCEPNPRGREHGIARGIALTRSGRRHPMFDGCLQTFDGCAAHTDHVAASWAAAPVCRPGVEAEVLASNDFTPVQGLAVRIDGGEFWSVQYHPELDLGEIARLMRLPASRSLLVEQGEVRRHLLLSAPPPIPPSPLPAAAAPHRPSPPPLAAPSLTAAPLAAARSTRARRSCSATRATSRRSPPTRPISSCGAGSPSATMSSTPRAAPAR